MHELVLLRDQMDDMNGELSGWKEKGRAYGGCSGSGSPGPTLVFDTGEDYALMSSAQE